MTHRLLPTSSLVHITALGLLQHLGQQLLLWCTWAGLSQLAELTAAERHLVLPGGGHVVCDLAAGLAGHSLGHQEPKCGVGHRTTAVEEGPGRLQE